MSQLYSVVEEVETKGTNTYPQTLPTKQLTTPPIEKPSSSEDYHEFTITLRKQAKRLGFKIRKDHPEERSMFTNCHALFVLSCQHKQHKLLCYSALNRVADSHEC